MGTPDVSYFFEQTHFRKTPKRYKKAPEELPHDLRFAHLNPRVAAYLANKEKEAKEGRSGSFTDDGLGDKSLLPQINQTVSLIRQKLNDFLSDDDAQRYLFEEAKISAIDLLEQLARLLYSLEGIRPHIPKSLESQLLASFKELTANVRVVARDWQLLSNKEEYLQKHFLSSESSTREIKSERSDYPPSPGSVAMGGDEGDDKGLLTSRSNRDQDVKSRSRSSKAPPSRASHLGDIPEAKDEDVTGSRTSLDTVRGHRPADLGGVPTVVLPSARRAESRDRPSPGPRAKTRLEKFKSSMTLEPGRPPSATSNAGLLRSRGSRHDGDTASVRSHYSRMSMDGNRSVANNAGYWGVIQFQLSSKACQDRGWILHPSEDDDLERETVIGWAAQRLQLALKQKQEQEDESKELGLDGPVVLKFYGDSRREQIQKYKMGTVSTRTPTAKALLKGQKPQIPSMKWRAEGKSLFMATVSDGSTTVCYPSGRPAIVTSKASLGKPGFYTIIYDNNPEQRMLGCFTPSGRGCCYHDNGVVRFLSSEKGGTLADTDGSISKRWEWPPAPQKLAVTIVVQLNPYLTLRCVNNAQMQILFNCQRETTKVNVGIVPGAEDAPSREEMGHLVSGLPMYSQAAKDYSRPFKPKQHKNKHKGKAKSKSPVPASEVQKILDLPETTEYDMECEKDLAKLQRKIKNVVEDWQEHYRIAVGISSPYLRSVPDGRRPRDTSSAKSSPGGIRVIIESFATQCAKPSVSRRAPSAPAGHRVHERPATSNASKDRDGETSSTVKFGENPDDPAAVVEVQSIAPSTPYVQSVASGTSKDNQVLRSRSAPNRLILHTPADGYTPSIGLCPVALRTSMLEGERGVTCKCSRHKIPYITDVEFDVFTLQQVPGRQLLIVAVVSSLFPEAMQGQEMLEHLHIERNRNRTRPCLQSKNDPFRLVLYDVTSASELTDYTQPLLMRRHNVIPGMFLMYEDGKLIFCDHIFNGYGNARKDFHKQIMQTRRSASIGRCLPQDFRFSPIKGRHGPRSAWGGEIGGAGVDRHGGQGLSLDAAGITKRSSLSSLSSSDSKDVDYQTGGANTSRKFMSMSLTTAAYEMLARQEPATPRDRAPAPSSVSWQLPETRKLKLKAGGQRKSVKVV